jgi:hypothetical protein
LIDNYKRKSVNGSRPGSPIGLGNHGEEFSQEERERVLELLLSQERVVTLLYAKTFPVNMPNQQTAPSGIGRSTAGVKLPSNIPGIEELLTELNTADAENNGENVES